MDRSSHLGGSDIPAILGLSKFVTPLDVWREKVGPDVCRENGIEPLPERQDTGPMKWGRILEPVLVQEAAKSTGFKLGPAVEITEDWKIAHLDATLNDDPLEAKTARGDDGWGESGSDDIPSWYLPQVLWYMHMANRQQAHVAALIGGSDFRVYRIERDQKLEDAILEAAKRFWFEHVVEGKPPESTSLEESKVRWAAVAEGSTLPIEPVMADIADLRYLKEQAKQIETAIERRQFNIREYMKDAETLVLPDGTPAVSLKLTTVKEQTIVRKASSFRSLRFLKGLDKVGQ